MININEYELNRNPRVSQIQKNAVRYLVESANNGNDADRIKLNQAVRLYKVENAIEEDEIPITPKSESSLGMESSSGVESENDIINGGTSECGYYCGVAPETDSFKWFYDPDTVQWVGFPSDKEFLDSSPEEIIYRSRYDLPDWEVYVPLDYQRPEKSKVAPIHAPMQTPIGRQNGGKHRFSSRLERSVGVGGIQK